MLETNVGRAHNVALASLPGFSLPGDISASARYYAQDIASPGFELNADSTLTVPAGPGIGVELESGITWERSASFGTPVRVSVP
jgi:O-succinylbenzoate synthase